MANPQAENGHTDIANELMEVLARTDLSGGEIRIILVVLRKTWAWKKKADWISLTQLERLTGLSRSMICRIKKKLVNKSILAIQNNRVSFNKNYEKWLVNDSTLVNFSTRGSELKDNQLVNQSTHTKETITKETNTTTVASPRIVIKNESMPVEEITYEPLEAKKGKSKYGKKTMFLFAAKYLETAGIKLESGEQYDAGKISEGLSKLYKQLKDPDKVLEALELGAKYFKKRKLDWTPEAIWRNWEKIRQENEDKFNSGLYE